MDIAWVRGRDRGRVEERGIVGVREWWRRRERWCEREGRGERGKK